MALRYNSRLVFKELEKTNELLMVNILQQDTKMAERLMTYSAISTELALLSDQRLSMLLEKAEPLSSSICGTTSLLKIGGAPVFVKKIRLTDVEKQPENVMSTANLFDLPMYFQYGIGSQGFGAWRELAVHIMTTNWVLAGKCLNFPLMYQWRVLPRLQHEEPTKQALNELEKDVAFWDGSQAVRARMLASLQASTEIVLFLEHMPENLQQWLQRQMAQGSEAAESACTMVEKNLHTITSFINSHGLLHFDAHFWNILTDGHCLYFSDFGLAISDRFELSPTELDLFKQHHNYDFCYTMAFFVEYILRESFGSENYETILHEFATESPTKMLPPIMAAIVTRYAPMTTVMNAFHRTLKIESKETPYPVDELERLNHSINQL